MIKWSFYKFILLTQMISIFCCAGLSVSAQTISNTNTDSSSIRRNEMVYYKNQRDIVDVALRILKKNPDVRLDSNGIKAKKVYLSVGPILEYTLSTGFTTGIAGSGAFLTSAKEKTNTSV